MKSVCSRSNAAGERASASSLFQWNSSSMFSAGCNVVGSPCLGAKCSSSNSQGHKIVAKVRGGLAIPEELHNSSESPYAPSSTVLSEHVVLSVVSLSGQEHARISDATLEWRYSDVVARLPELFPWQFYTLTLGEHLLDGSRTLGHALGATPTSDDPVQIIAVKSESEIAEADMHEALLTAAQALDLQMVERLLKCKGSASSSSDALHEAIAANCCAPFCTPPKIWAAVVWALIAGQADVNVRRNGKTAFEKLVPHGLRDATLLRMCLNAGGDANADFSRNADSKKGKPLLYLATATGNTHVARELLKAGAEVDLMVESTDGHGACGLRHVSEASLHAACAAGNTEMASLLLANRANVNETRRELLSVSAEADTTVADDGMRHMRETSLHVACAVGHLAMVSLLIENLANVNAVRRRAQGTAVDSRLSMTTSRCEHAQADGSLRKVVLRGLMNDATRGRRSNRQCTADNIEGGPLDLVKESALHVALQRKHETVVKLLVAARADINCRQLCGDVTKTAEELCEADRGLLNALR